MIGIRFGNYLDSNHESSHKRKSLAVKDEYLMLNPMTVVRTTNLKRELN